MTEPPAPRYHGPRRTARRVQSAASMSEAPPVTANANFDGDSDVDGVDFLAWQKGFGKSPNALLSDGDADGNGAVDGADLAIWKDQFGATGLAVAAAGSVPEPAPRPGPGCVLAPICQRPATRVRCPGSPGRGRQRRFWSSAQEPA